MEDKEKFSNSLTFSGRRNRKSPINDRQLVPCNWTG